MAKQDEKKRNPKDLGTPEEGKKDPRQPPREGGEEVKEAKSAFKLAGMLFDMTGKPGINEAVGNDIPLIDGYNSSAPFDGNNSFRIPGVAAIYWLSVYGIARDLSDPANIAVQKMYLKLQEIMKNRTLPFEGVNMMEVVLASDQVAAGYTLIVRAVQALGVANIASRYLPVSLFDAMGWDYNDFLEHLADIKEQLKVWKELIDNYMYVPDIFPMFRAHQQMCKYIYTDGQGEKAQCYVCMPSHLWSWGNNDQTWTMEAVKLTAARDDDYTPWTWTQVKAAMDQLILTTLGSTDFQRISAAIKTTYMELGVKPVELTGPDAIGPLVFMTDEDFINVLQNADVIDVPDNLVSTWAPHDNGNNTIICSGTVSAHADYERRPVLYNTTTDRPEPSEMVNFSRWKVSIAGASNTVDSVGTEIITQIKIAGPASLTLNSQGQREITRYPLFTGRSGGQGTFVTTTEFMYRYRSTLLSGSYSYRALSAADAFSGFPMLFLYEGNVIDTGDDENRWLVPIVHWNFMARMSNADLKAYHRALIYSSFLE